VWGDHLQVRFSAQGSSKMPPFIITRHKHILTGSGLP
jgi:hypothetical protein